MSQHDDNHENENHSHHILPDAMAFKILGLLLFLTVVTVATAQIDLGAFNFPLAMIIASIKASVVCMFFMGLKYDHKENTVIFSTSLIFMAIFMILTFGDLLTRGNVYVKDYERGGPIIPAGLVAEKSKFQKPWMVTPELIAHGKEQFKNQCVSCHGDVGQGNGPAAAGLNPKPRNFTVADGWKNGRKPSQIFVTLTKGLNAMPSFGSLPSDDRWGLVHYVRTLGPHEAEKDTDADLKKVGIDPNAADGGGGGEKSVPIEVAIDALAEPAPTAAQNHK